MALEILALFGNFLTNIGISANCKLVMYLTQLLPLLTSIELCGFVLQWIHEGFEGWFMVNNRHSLLAALNGDRAHPATPRTPGELAAEACAAVEAGAQSLHLHPYDEEGKETLEARPCAAALRAVRKACPGTPISLSTSASIEPIPERRLELIDRWTELPDLVTANQGEEGIAELCRRLAAKGVGIEAGLLTLDDAKIFVRSGIANECKRVLVEPLDADPQQAVAHADEIENILREAEILLEQVHHGDGIASWAVNRRAVNRGHGIRTGLEDTPVLPNGRVSTGNGELVAAAAEMLANLA